MEIKCRYFRIEVKTWESMVNEFGLDAEDEISKVVFVSDMEKLMPKDRIVLVTDSGWHTSYHWGDWIIHRDAVKQIIEEVK